jgi:hypothetical protein
MQRIEFLAPLQAHWRVAEEPTPYGVERPRVYLDTSIPSYLTNRLNRQADVVRRQRITDIWWRRYTARFELFVSDEVKKEAAAGNTVLAQQRLKFLQGITSLDSSLQSTALAALLIETRVLPLTARTDAQHIAIAATHSMHYLLTWNCKHMANPFIAHRLVQSCEMLGFRSPKICTPEVLMRMCHHERPDP